MTPPGHPESPERAHVFDVVASDFKERGGVVREPVAATRQQLGRVHSAAHLDRIASTAGGRPSMLDPDTFTSPGSHEIAQLAAGAAVQAARHAMATREPALALVRPPGHHAERDRPMGFCLYNNVAVAAADAIAAGTERVAIVDIDVHHGNGTQWIFYDDPRVLYVSSHQFPFYPGTGAADECGHTSGLGFTVNLPLEAGATDADYELVYRYVVGPVVTRFAPQLTLVSAGFDAHEADPLASMRMTAGGYARILRVVADAARQSGVVALVTEGGYDLPAMRECIERCMAAIERPGELDETAGSPAAPRGERALQIVRAAQSSYWRGL